MTKKIRLIILIVCVICFSVTIPYIVLYSQGYRIDFSKMKIFATGGIYIRTFPAADQIIIDSKDYGKPGLFANDLFIPNLLPEKHTISIKKAGFFDYSKALLVEETLTTKLENILLFKKSFNFQEVIDKTKNPFLAQNQKDKYILKNNNLYYSTFSATDLKLTTIQSNTPLIKGLLAFSILNNRIVWLSATDGFLYRSDANGKNPEKLGQSALKINKKGTYKIIVYGNDVFVNNNGLLTQLNYSTGAFDEVANGVSDATISLDEKYIAYTNKKEIFLTSLSDKKEKGILLYKSSSEDIKNIIWINNSYIIFTSGNKIVISEIDYRENINTVLFPDSIIVGTAKPVKLVDPKISFNSQENRLYISTGESLFSFDKLIP